MMRRLKLPEALDSKLSFACNRLFQFSIWTDDNVEVTSCRMLRRFRSLTLAQQSATPMPQGMSQAPAAPAGGAAPDLTPAPDAGGCGKAGDQEQSASQRCAACLRWRSIRLFVKPEPPSCRPELPASPPRMRKMQAASPQARSPLRVSLNMREPEEDLPN